MTCAIFIKIPDDTFDTIAFALDRIKPNERAVISELNVDLNFVEDMLRAAKCPIYIKTNK